MNQLLIKKRVIYGIVIVLILMLATSSSSLIKREALKNGNDFKSDDFYLNVSVQSNLFCSTLPTTFDWRDVNGTNFITPVKDQGECAGCTAFAYVAACEAERNIQAGQVLEDNDLSEAWVMFKLGNQKCDGTGGTPNKIYHKMRRIGVVDEECFPYDGAINGNNLPPDDHCDNWEERCIKHHSDNIVEMSSSNLAIPRIKRLLYMTGPIASINMKMYENFREYDGGIYEPEGDLDDEWPTHSVLIVGYNEPEKYWICKNSMGEDWGENGFFKIPYGECDIEHFFASFNIIDNPPKFESPKEGGLYIFNIEIFPIDTPFGPLPCLFQFNYFPLGYEFIPIIVGKIKIKPHLPNKEGINKIEFYIDDELKYNDKMAPFEWMWDDVGLHQIKTVAYDNDGDVVNVKWQDALFI